MSDDFVVSIKPQEMALRPSFRAMRLFDNSSRLCPRVTPHIDVVASAADLCTKCPEAWSAPEAPSRSHYATDWRNELFTYCWKFGLACCLLVRRGTCMAGYNDRDVDVER